MAVPGFCRCTSSSEIDLRAPPINHTVGVAHTNEVSASIYAFIKFGEASTLPLDVVAL
jgi:hypothetical protein